MGFMNYHKLIQNLEFKTKIERIKKNLYRKLRRLSNYGFFDKKISFRLKKYLRYKIEMVLEVKMR